MRFGGLILTPFMRHVNTGCQMLNVDFVKFLWKSGFLELKVANQNYKAFAKTKGISFTESQTEQLRKMKNLPIVFACDEDNMNFCCLIKPEELRQLQEAPGRKGQDMIRIGVRYLKQTSYREALNNWPMLSVNAKTAYFVS